MNTNDAAYKKDNAYQEYTDKYFLRSKEILEKKNINPIVRYQVFARKDIDAIKGITEAVEYIHAIAGDRVSISAAREGQHYHADMPVLKLEGHVQDLIDLETIYLGILSGRNTPNLDLGIVREKARAIISAAQGKPVFYFGARHFHPSYDADIGRICIEEGFAGASTDIGAAYSGNKGVGTVPHANILAFDAYMESAGIQGNPTVEAMKAFDEIIDPKVPRVMLIDTYNREIADSLATARAVKRLSGVRIDTCGENYSQGSDLELQLDIPEKYLKGKGVTVAAVWALRRNLDANSYDNLSITVSSGFNAGKTCAFMIADNEYHKKYGRSLFDSIGTGSIADPVMFTSDIIAYYDAHLRIWLPHGKVGRKEQHAPLNIVQQGTFIEQTTAAYSEGY
ncbi:MAG: nicotinate phosphoribosyltransferase [Candidatus Woesearchaeota archaeon]